MFGVAYPLIFGGCCANVYALEAILKHESDTGLLITAAQFFLVSLYALPSQWQASSARTGDGQRGKSYRKVGSSTKAVSDVQETNWAQLWTPPYFRDPSIPLPNLMLIAVMFFSVNMLNNWAFAFHISVPMHIILRSFGSVITMFVGWCIGKTYSTVQTISVLALTVGVVVSAWADARAKGANLDMTSNTAVTNWMGLLVLFVAQLISAVLGVYSEVTYTTHGRHWQETLFYSHALSLLFSISMIPTLVHQARKLLNASAAFRQTFGLSGLSLWELSYAPPPLLFLLLNAATQLACITGVNRLSAITSAVTVTIVLNVRKLVSFLLSCVIFGNRIDTLMAVGATVVFASGAVYGWDAGRRKSKNKAA